MKDHPISELFPMMSEADLDALAADIKANGLHHPVTTLDGEVLDGRNRLEACRRAGVEPRFQEWRGRRDHDSVVAWVVSENLHRRHLNESQRGMVAARLKYLFEAFAKQRMLSTLKKGDAKPASANWRERDEAGKASERAAEMLNVSPRTVERATRVVEHGTPELVRAVEDGQVAVSAAVKMTTTAPERQREIVERVRGGLKPAEATRQIRRDDLSKKSAALPDGKYRVIYADPPWKYDENRTTLDGYESSTAAHQYPTMSEENLCSLDVRALAADDSVLFCWATFPLLDVALRVVKAWGFTYKTAFVWDKVRPNLGWYHQANAEVLLVAIRGSGVPETDKREDQVQVVERTGRHSEKPEHFRAMIDRLYASGPRIELFRRGDAPEGWRVWGNESK